MRSIPIIIAIVSVPAYFCAPLLLLIWRFSDDDTLAWIWAFGGGMLLFPLFGLSCFGGLLTWMLLYSVTSDRSKSG
jgi:hypothetical protein